MRKRRITGIILLCALCVYAFIFYRRPAGTALFKSKDHFVPQVE